jgi:hypothetical protein
MVAELGLELDELLQDSVGASSTGSWIHCVLIKVHC